jgi:hypothetical protein
MSVPRRDADSALRKVEKRPAGGPLGGGQDSPSADEGPHCPTDPLPARGRPQPEPHREPAPEGRFSARRPRRRGTDVDSPPFCPPLATVQHGSTLFNTVSHYSTTRSHDTGPGCSVGGGSAAGPCQSRGAMRTARCGRSKNGPQAVPSAEARIRHQPTGGPTVQPISYRRPDDPSRSRIVSQRRRVVFPRVGRSALALRATARPRRSLGGGGAPRGWKPLMNP